VAQPLTKQFWRGTHRIVPPEETLERVGPLAGRAGITRIANVTGLDWIGLPVVMVCRPNARSLSVSQGKGLTLEAAAASGVMESLELYHAEQVQLPLRLMSYHELLAAHENVADVSALPRSATSIFHPDRRLLWVEGNDLLQDEAIWVPYELVHADYTLPYPTGSGCFPMTSNGLASGNHLLEALSHGICEVVERDAHRLFTLTGEADKERRRVNIATIDDPDCTAVMGLLDEAGIDVAIWEMTSDVGLAAFSCVIAEREENPMRPFMPAAGNGCHPDRAIALLRALTEAAQSRLTQIAGSRDDVDRLQIAPLPLTDDADQWGLEPGGDSAGRSFRDAPTRGAETLDDDVAWELECLRRVGITRVVTVNLSHPDSGIAVVRIVIPGLEGPSVVRDLLPGERARGVLGVSP
jgi:ribosomal protein S12 methylthiotransferase accessory factor